MAALVLIDPTVTIDSVDMSAFIKEVQLGVEADDIDTTTFTGDGWKTSTAGLKGGEIQFTFNDDFAVTTVDDRIWGWFGTTITFAVRADSGAISTSNPSYSGSVVVTKATPLAGKVGELAEQSLTWPLTGALTRATS